MMYREVHYEIAKIIHRSERECEEQGPSYHAGRPEWLNVVEMEAMILWEEIVVKSYIF